MNQTILEEIAYWSFDHELQIIDRSDDSDPFFGNSGLIHHHYGFCKLTSAHIEFTAEQCLKIHLQHVVEIDLTYDKNFYPELMPFAYSLWRPLRILFNDIHHFKHIYIKFHDDHHNIKAKEWRETIQSFIN